MRVAAANLAGIGFPSCSLLRTSASTLIDSGTCLQVIVMESLSQHNPISPAIKFMAGDFEEVRCAAKSAASASPCTVIACHLSFSPQSLSEIKMDSGSNSGCHVDVRSALKKARS